MRTRHFALLFLAALLFCLPASRAAADGPPIIGENGTATLLDPTYGGYLLESTVDPNGYLTSISFQINGPSSDNWCNYQWCNLDGTGTIGPDPGAGPVSHYVYGLTSTDYKFRVVAISIGGTVYGPEHPFTATPALPYTPPAIPGPPIGTVVPEKNVANSNDNAAPTKQAGKSKKNRCGVGKKASRAKGKSKGCGKQHGKKTKPRR